MEPNHQLRLARNPSSDPHRPTSESRTTRQSFGDTPSAVYQRELERAKAELDEERHKPLGFTDDIKNLFGWIETPEERLHRNRPDLVD